MPKKTVKAKKSFPKYLYVLIILVGGLLFGLSKAKKAEVLLINQPAITEIPDYRKAIKIGENSGIIWPAIVPNTSFTFEAWIYPEEFKSDTAEDRYIFSQPSSSSGVQISLSLQGHKNYNNGKGMIAAFYWDSKGPHQLNSPSVVTVNNWHHVAFVKSEKYVTIFLDGEAIISQEAFGNTPSYDRDWFTLGAFNNLSPQQNFPQNSFRGIIDDVVLTGAIKYSSNFVLPKQPAVASKSTIALFHLDGNYKNSVNSNLKGGAPSGREISFVDSTVPVIPSIPCLPIPVCVKNKPCKKIIPGRVYCSPLPIIIDPQN